MAIASEIKAVLAGFETIGLEEISRAALMRRKDSKYVFPVVLLPRLLEAVKAEYRAVEVMGGCAQPYETTYFDTPELDMYKMHHNGRVNRHKVRIRKYGATSDIFLEVKKKDARGLTVKNRVAAREANPAVLSEEEEFLSSFTPYHHKAIHPVLKNSFKRITLVRHDQRERITLDFQLFFSSEMSEANMELPGVAIAEIKYEGLLTNSPFHVALRALRVVPRRISKYCTGMALLNPELKQNLFKEKIRYIQKLNIHYLEHKTQQLYA